MYATLTLLHHVGSRVPDRHGWAGPLACLAALAIPAVALAECLIAAAWWLSAAVAYCRSKLAAALHRAALALDPESCAPTRLREEWAAGFAAGRRTAPDATPAPLARVPLPVIAARAAGVTPASQDAPTLVVPTPVDGPLPEWWTLESSVAAGLAAQEPAQEPAPSPTVAAVASEPFVGPVAPALDTDSLRAAVAQHGGIRAAARALGLSESTLRSRLKRAAAPKRGAA